MAEDATGAAQSSSAKAGRLPPPPPSITNHVEDSTAEHSPRRPSDKGDHDSKAGSSVVDTQRKTDIAELPTVHERLLQVESKMNVVDYMHRINKETDDALNQKGGVYPSLSRPLDESDHRSHLAFYQDALLFMSRLRNSYMMLQRHERNKREADAKTKKQFSNSSESEIMKSISTEAFTKGKRAKVMQVSWETFLLPKGNMEESTLAPINVVASEPESQTILQLGPIFLSKKKRDKLKASPGVERIWSPAAGEEEPLPERIKIHSAPLLAIFQKISKSPPWARSDDGSVVFLRPYQHLVYYEPQLRAHLESLEKEFENYSASQDVPGTSKEGKVGDSITDSTPKPGVDLTSEVLPSGTNEAATSASDAKVTSTGEHDAEKATEHDQNNDEMEEEEEIGQASTNSITALLHLRCLVDFIQTEIKPKQAYIKSAKCTRIHFHDLWNLFKPGDEVIDRGEKQSYVVLRVQAQRHKIEESWERWYKRASDSSDSEDDGDEDRNPFILHCAYIDFDGKTFGPVSQKFRISPFGEFKPIRSLPVYPIRFTKDSQARENLIKRGQLLLDVAKFKAMYYMGPTLDKRDDIDSQVVVDFTEALADETRRKEWEPKIGPVNTAADDNIDGCIAICCDDKIIREGFDIDDKMTEDYIKSVIPDTSLRPPSLILSPRTLEETLNAIDELTETELLVMTYRVFGFVLRSRKWAQLDLTLLRHENVDARASTVDAFERLELPEGHSEMVKSLVVQHFRSKQSGFAKDEQTDLIQGKGKGLIMLLHGAPGVGKTTTAEGIGELFRKPLFQITCGDLGSTAREVENELEKNFALASRWGCILLLDEADVFLSARERMDFKRNGLVAVFLRVLEYYTGILFLTTNRIGDFDEAFASRIHMSLYYPELDEVKTLKVFNLNLDLIKQRFKKQGRQITFDPSSIAEFAQQHFRQHEYNRWNGRQIRNACQTALALAEFDAQGATLDIDSKVDKSVVVQLELKYFKTVQKAYLDFDRYLGDIQGTQGDRRAIDYKLRARTDTPYQTKPSAFSQRDDGRSATRHSMHQRYAYDQRTTSHMPQPSFGPPADSFNQAYRPMTPNSGMSQAQGYGSYAPQPHNNSSYPAQQRPGYGAERDLHERPRSFGQPESSQMTPADPRFSQGSQHGQQFDTTQSSQVMYGEEPARHAASYYNDGSPLPNRATQYQQPQYGPSGSMPGADPRGPAIQPQDRSAYEARSLFRDRQQGPSEPFPSQD